MKKAWIVAVAIILVIVCVGRWEVWHLRQAYLASYLPSSVTPVRGAQAKLNSQRLVSKFARLPLSFEENRGQFDPQVKFATRGANYGLFLSSGHATIVHHSTIPEDNGDLISAVAGLNRSDRRTTSTTQLSWVGANPNVEPRALGLQRGESNYFIGRDARKWRRHVRHYDRVQLAGLYPGIDLIYHGAQQRVEFDYVVAPHVDPGAVQVGISGPSIVALDAEGQLSISGSGDTRLLKPPIAYQEINGKRETVKAQYALTDSHQFGFRLGKYDASLPVIIDPVLEFAASFGPNRNDTVISDVVLDSTGNIYITGMTCETNYPTTAGVFQQVGGNNLSPTCNDAVVTKLDPAASTLIYSTYIGGQSVDFGIRLLVDATGEATVVGTTASTDFPTTPGAYQPSAKGGTCNYSPTGGNGPCTDAFLLKLSADGSTLQYSTLFGGERAEIALALTQDSAGNSYIAGATNSVTLPLAGSPYQSSYNGGAMASFTSGEQCGAANQRSADPSEDCQKRVQS